MSRFSIQSRSARRRLAVLSAAAAACLVSALCWVGTSQAASAKLNTFYEPGAAVAGADGSTTIGAITARCDRAGLICNGSTVSTYPDLAVIRMDSRGRTDSGFGDDGLVVLPTTVVDGGLAGVAGIAEGANGTTLIALATAKAADVWFELVRLEADGGLSTGFGDGGRVRLSKTDSGGFVPATGPHGIVVSSTGVTYVLGQLLPTPTTPPNLAVAAFTPSGNLDSGFGVGGIASVPIPGATTGGPGALALVPDGSLLVAGSRVDASISPRHGEIVAARLLADGALDPGFGAGGFRAFGGIDAIVPEVSAAAAFAFGDTRLVAGSQAVGPPEQQQPCADTVLGQTNQSGALDGGFGQQGQVIDAPAGGCGVVSAARDASGRIGVLLGGQAFGLQRYSDAGAKDPAFGNNGAASFKIAGFESSGVQVLSTGDSLLSVGVVRGSTQCKKAAPANGRCTAIGLARLDRRGRLDDNFGRGGVATFPKMHICGFAPTRKCGVDLSDQSVRGLVRQELPDTLRLSHGVSGTIRCARAIQAKCRLNLTLSRAAGGRPLAQTSATIPSGKRKRVHWSLSSNLARRLSPGQDVVVTARTKFAGRRDLKAASEATLK